MYSRAQKRLVNSQKYGVDLVRFTHAKNAAIHASTKRDDAIRYLSLHDNKVKLLVIRLTLENIHLMRESFSNNKWIILVNFQFIRYFTGHTKRVISLEMSPTDDTFMSGSLDNSVRLWDLRTPNCSGIMQVQGKPVSEIKFYLT